MIVWKFKSFVGDGLMHILQMLSRSQIYMATPSQLNDINEGRWIHVNEGHTGDLDAEWGQPPSVDFLQQVGEVNNKILEYRITSFCSKATVTDPLMWGHYAGGSNGVAIAYDLSNVDPNRIHEVQYEGVPVICRSEFASSRDKVEFLINKGVLRSKEPCWKTEGEVRILKAPGEIINGCGDECFMSLDPKAIVIGCKEPSPHWNIFSSISHQFEIPFGFLCANSRSNHGFHVLSQEPFFNEFDE